MTVIISKMGDNGVYIVDQMNHYSIQITNQMSRQQTFFRCRKPFSEYDAFIISYEMFKQTNNALSPYSPSPPDPTRPFFTNVRFQASCLAQESKALSAEKSIEIYRHVLARTRLHPFPHHTIANTIPIRNIAKDAFNSVPK